MTLISYDDMQHRTEIYFPETINIYEALVSSGIVIEADCGGKHSCGKCFVFVDGEANLPQKDEVKLLNLTEMKRPELLNDRAQLRLACFCHAVGDCDVYYKDRTREQPLERISITTEIQKVRGGNTRLGAAVDIGTTTVECAIYDLVTEERLFYIREKNAQSVFGSDVLSRIERSNSAGAKEQQDVLVKQVFRMLRDGAELSLADPEQIARIVVTGNTTMLHFFAGLDPKGIGVSPFTPKSLFGYETAAKDTFGHFHRAGLYLAPCVGSYVGGDITCGILATSLTKKGERNLLVDVGTNGEIALSVNGNLVCCSTAAGPAFEGGEIAMGMIASKGAVNRVYLESGELKYTTIENGEPVGICGTGIITAVEALLAAGVIDETGRLLTEKHPLTERMMFVDGMPAIYIAEDQVYLTQRDIRNVQLAKAAIAAGVETVLHEQSLSSADISHLYLSGGFGSGIDPASAAAIGLFPRALVPVTNAAGNSALSGAVMLLFTEKKREEAEMLSKNAREISLSANAFFMDSYIEQMGFGFGIKGPDM